MREDGKPREFEINDPRLIYPISYRVLYLIGGCLRFLPPTVPFAKDHLGDVGWFCCYS